MLLESIEAGLEHRGEAMRYAMRFGRGIDVATADRFVGMYVNELTCDYGDEGRRAVAELLGRGEAIGAFPEPVGSTTFVDALSYARAASGAKPAVPRRAFSPLRSRLPSCRPSRRCLPDCR